MLLTMQLFEPLIHKQFDISFNNESSSKCELVEVKEINSQTLAHGQSRPFSLLLQTNDLNKYEQGAYNVVCDELEDFLLFLVPVYGDNEIVQYEAVFT